MRLNLRQAARLILNKKSKRTFLFTASGGVIAFLASLVYIEFGST